MSLQDIPTDVLQAELARRANPADLPDDPLHALLMKTALTRVAEAEEAVLVAEVQARQRAEARRAELIALRAMRPQDIVVRVHISDPWDSAYPGNSCGSVSVTEQGLERAIKAAESQHERSAGKVRTDGVLGYSVSAQLPGGQSVEVPERMWLAYSQQTAASMRKRRATDKRQWGR